MTAQHPTLSHWKHNIIVWRKQAHVIGVIFGVTLWAVLAVGWPVLLAGWLLMYR